jgi:predicted unusual protein kinase regulating ubiquinone biosynthesis (AarF/ABC1/UbiB family)
MLNIFNNFKKSLGDELDFLTEIKNAELTRELFMGDSQIMVPKINHDWKSSRLIIMEYVEGKKINDKKGIVDDLKLDPTKCSKLLIETFAKMMFQFGHVHCDAHPGNLLIR